MASSSSSAEKSGTMQKLPQFDVATDDTDHKYVASKQEVASGSLLYKSIMKEWQILQQNLPESIFVRVYETRMELMRAVIVGPRGIPYHDGLFFFFDILFPSDYPNRPPSVKYWSFGFLLNPNLYANRLVCLSLLNTWNGQGNGKWVPGKSTVLQLLLSIEGLVLNEMPFFNEPGIKAENDKAPRAYNDGAFVLSCKIMLLLLRSPLTNFKGFILDHFRERARNILTSCQAYANGFLVVGQYRDGHTFLEKPIEMEKRLRTHLEWCYNSFVDVFKKNDPLLEEFLKELNQLVETTKKEYRRRKKEKWEKTVMGRAVKMERNIVTLRKCSTGKVEHEQ